jgi:hypothetical protein
MWDELSLTKLLVEIGFRAIRRCDFNDCSDPMFNLCEDYGRFNVELNGVKFKELALECRK